MEGRTRGEAAAGPGFHYPRQVQFAETDLAGIVHFSCIFKYMEEAEHALWRAAGLSVAQRGSDIGWPRVSAAFEFRNPLRFEDDFDVIVRLAHAGTRSLRYDHTIVRGDTLIGTGTITTVAVRQEADGQLRSVQLPPDVLRKLQERIQGFK